MTIKYRLEKQSTRSFVARKTTVILVTICINVIKKKNIWKFPIFSSEPGYYFDVKNNSAFSINTFMINLGSSSAQLSDVLDW